MLTFEQIKELVELIAARGLHGMEVERSGFRLKIDGKAPATAAPSIVSAGPVYAPAAPSAAADPGVAESAPTHLPGTEPAPPSPPAATSNDHVLTSPIVGTFYSAPSPDAPPFVSVGSKVKKGQVLCIIEAMKLMNEIESDTPGEVVQVYPQNAQAVEFGQPLFAIRPS